MYSLSFSLSLSLSLFISLYLSPSPFSPSLSLSHGKRLEVVELLENGDRGKLRSCGEAAWDCSMAGLFPGNAATLRSREVPVTMPTLLGHNKRIESQPQLITEVWWGDFDLNPNQESQTNGWALQIYLYLCFFMLLLLL